MNLETFCSRFSEYEEARSRLFCRLIRQERNMKDGNGPVCRPWMDLALSCYYDLSEDGMPEAAVAIRRSCLSLWQVSERKVLADAMRNTAERETVVFRRLDLVLSEMQEDMEEVDKTILPEQSPLYLLSNEKRMFGAVFMAMPDVLRKIGKELENSFYILPSSIHECLILSAGTSITADELNGLVSMINREYVEDKEILADHVYYYDSTAGHILLC